MNEYRQHAPAPWRVEENDTPDAPAFPYVIRDAQHWSIALMTGSFQTPRTDENARLIAAAPDLYRALYDIAHGSAYDAAAKARAVMALESVNEAQG